MLDVKDYVFFLFSSRRRHTRCSLVTGVQTCALPIYQLVELFTQIQDFARLNLDIAGLALRTARGLMDHHARVRQRETLALGARRQRERTQIGRASCRERVCPDV